MRALINIILVQMSIRNILLIFICQKRIYILNILELIGMGKYLHILIVNMENHQVKNIKIQLIGKEIFIKKITQL